MTDLRTSTIASLLRLGSLPASQWDAALQEILRIASEAIGVGRVSYWRFRSDPAAIVCELAYVSENERFERGLVLPRSSAPSYFQEIERSQVLVAEDVQRDPRTRDLGSYLTERNIGSLIDAPVHVDGNLVGILCHEHVGPPRTFSTQEQEFVLAVGQILAGRLEARARTAAEAQRRHATWLADAMAALAETLNTKEATSLAVHRALPELGDLATLVAFENGELRHLAGAHVRQEGREVLEEIVERYPPSIERPGFVGQVVRERQSLLIPAVTLDAVRPYGIDDDYFALIKAFPLHTIIAVPLHVRGTLTGAMVFGKARTSYTPDDLRIAESYAQRIGVLLENSRLYDQAQKAIEVRDQFLSLASHELRTPITVLRLSAEALARGSAAVSPKIITQMSERLVRQAGRLDRLTGRLLSAWEMRFGPPSIDRERVDLSEVVRDVASAFTASMERAGSTLVLPTDPVVGDFDPIRIEQVIGNLIDNAMKFGAGKPVTVEVHGNDTRARVLVRDQGIGVPPDGMEDLFDRYERAAAGRSFGGLGLGLNIVREIVRAHGGEVTVESKGGGMGTTFVVELPRWESAQPTAM